MASEFWKLGLGEPYPVSAIHGSGTGDLLDLVIGELPENNIQDDEEKIMMSIIGRPNVGKSCLLYTSPSPRDGRISRMPSSA